MHIWCRAEFYLIFYLEDIDVNQIQIFIHIIFIFVVEDF